MNMDESKKCSRNHCLYRDIPVDDLALNQESTTVLWFNPKLTEEDLSNSLFTSVRSLNDYFIFYTQKSLCLEYLASKQKQNDHIIAVLCDMDILDQVESCRQVCAILLLQLDDCKNMTIKHPSRKIVGSFNDETLLISNLQQVITEVEHQATQNIADIFSTFNRHERSLHDVRRQIGIFMWRQVFKLMLKIMPHTNDARQELLDYCRQYYNGNSRQLAKIDEFECSYRASEAISWYTKSSFLFRLLNKALRTEDIGGLYTFRYFIHDLCKTLEKGQDKQSIKTVYRGGLMSRDEIEHYHVGDLVAANGFLSTSLDLNVAYHFVGIDSTTTRSSSRNRDDQEQIVLFTIILDWDSSPDINVVDISLHSDYPDEKEVLFDIGTTFQIVEITYDSEHHLWHMKMRSSMEVTEINQEYEHYINQRLAETSSTLLFGILLTDMGEYERSNQYFQRLLTHLNNNNNGDQANAYYSTARNYRFTHEYDKALNYLYRAECLQRQRLPESNFDLARTLAGIASVYYELDDHQKELFYYQQSMEIYQTILPETHIEIARTFNRLGFAYFNQKQYEQALTYFAKSLSIFNQTVPETHPDKAFLLYNTGLVHYALGHLDESLDLNQKALKMRETALPSHHSYIAQSCYQLSILYKEKCLNDLALEYASRALSICEKKPSNNQNLIDQVQNIIELLLNS